MIRANIQAEPVDAKVHIEVEGKDGQTPHIGEDGNWYIGEKNTGMPSRGEKGNPGYSPEINVTDVPEGHAISIKDADGITHVVNVKDGIDGKPMALGEGNCDIPAVIKAAKDIGLEDKTDCWN